MIIQMQSLDNITTSDLLNIFINKIENENIEDSLDIIYNKNLDPIKNSTKQELKKNFSSRLEKYFKSNFKIISLKFNIKQKKFTKLFTIFKLLVINYTINYKFVDIKQFIMFSSHYYYFERNISNRYIYKVKYIIEFFSIAYAKLFNINI
jgi:hypothetical protein